MRVCLFTDTLADVNGVSRFIRDMVGQAEASGRELFAVTSTRLRCAGGGGIVNVRPMAARAMPGYPQIEVALPRAGEMLRVARRLEPGVVHVSTPGPVGVVGRWVARRLGVPLVATYHTDFPAYVDRLFEDAAYTWCCERFMRWFYRGCARVVTRSGAYGGVVAGLGVGPGRVVRLRAGIDTERFHPRWREVGVWERVGVPRHPVKVLYVGRVSVEKGMDVLGAAWKQARAAGALGDARLVVVGDGPHRAAMQRDLAGQGTHFLGFRHGEELSRLYASADLFVFPSATDTLGQVVMEAQASGLAAVVTDEGGPPEVVEDGRTGVVLPARDAAAWGREIAGLVADADRRAAMGEAACAKVGAMSIAASFEHFWGVHEEVVNEFSAAGGVAKKADHGLSRWAASPGAHADS